MSRLPPTAQSRSRPALGAKSGLFEQVRGWRNTQIVIPMGGRFMCFASAHCLSCSLHRCRSRRRLPALILAGLLALVWGAVPETAEARTPGSATRAVAQPINVGAHPHSIALTPDGNFAYVTNAEDDTVSVIDTDAKKVIHTIDVLASPRGIALNRDGSRAYVAGGEGVTEIDTKHNRVLRNIFRFPETPVGIAVDPRGLVWVTSLGSNRVVVYDPEEDMSIAKFRVPLPVNIALNSSGSLAYVSSLQDKVAVIETHPPTSVKLVKVNEEPSGITAAAHTGADHLAYVVATSGGTMDRIDASAKGGPKRTTSVAVGEEPTGVAPDPVLRQIYVTNAGDNTISVITSRRGKTVVKSFPSGGLNPTSIAVDPAGDASIVYVVNRGSNTVTSRVFEQES